MANDDQVFRLTWVFDGKQFSAELNAATANALSSMGSVGDADVRLTNIQVAGAKKRSEAKSQETSAINAAGQAQLNAANNAAGVFTAATERIITGSASSNRNLDALRKTYDQLSSTIIKTQRDIDKATDIIARNGLESKQGAEAAGLLTIAMQRLGELQATQKVTSAPALGGMDVVIRQYNEAVDAAQRYARQGLDSVLAKYDQTTVSARAMAGELARVDSAFKNGIITQEKYTQLNSQIIESYNLGAVAARRFAEEQARLNDTVNKIRNPTTPGQYRNFQQASGGFLPPGGGGVPPSSGGLGGGSGGPPFLPPNGPTGNELRAAAVSSQDLIAGAKESAAQIAKDNQAAIASLFGIDRAFKSAKESADAFAESFRNQDVMVASVQRLRDQIDPLGVAFRKYGEAVAEADKLVGTDNFSLGERDKAVKLAQYTFENATAAIRKNAQDTYTALKGASDSFQKSQMAGRVLSGPAAPTPEVASAATLGSQIQRNIVSGQPLDPKQIQTANELTDSLNRMAAAENAANAAAQKLKDELDPIGEVERNLSAIEAEYVEHLNQRRLSQEQATAATQKARDAANSQIAGITGLTAAQDDYAKLSKVADEYKAKLNPLIGAQKQYEAEVAKLTELVSVGLLPQRQINVAIDDYTKKLNAIAVAQQKVDAGQLNSQQISKQFKPILQQASQDFTNFSSTTTRAFGLNRIGFLELQAAGINAFQSLAAGISPLRTAETEGAQVVGALIQGTNLTLKQLISYAAPLAGVAAAFVAFGVAIAGAAAKATEIRQLNVALATFHQGTDATAEGLVKIEKEFARSGESASTLKTIIADLSRNPNINLSFVGGIEGILSKGRDIGAALGTDIAGGVKELTTALDNGAQGVIDLGLKLGVLSVSQGAEILLLNRTIGAQTAVKKGYEDIVSQLKPYTESLSPVQELTRSITGLWNEFIDSIENSEPVKNALTYIQELTKKITGLKDELKAQEEDKTSGSDTVFSGVLKGAATVGAAGAIVGTAVGAPGVITAPLGGLIGGVGGVIAGGIAGGADAYNRMQQRQAIGGSTNTQLLSGVGAGAPLPGPIALPTLSTYDIAARTALPGQAGQTVDSQTVALSSGLKVATESLSRFNTQISSSTTIDAKINSTEIANYDNQAKAIDTVNTSLQTLNTNTQSLATSFDKTATNISNIKIPSTIGGLSVGGAASPTAAGTDFISALIQLESSNRDITQKISDANSRKGTPAQGYAGIIDPTFQRYAPIAGYPQYKSALGLPRDVQIAVASQIPLNQYGERTQRGLIQQFGPLDTSKTVGQLAASTRGATSSPAGSLGSGVPDLKMSATVLGPSVEQTEATKRARLEADDALAKEEELVKALIPAWTAYGSTQTSLTAKEETRRTVQTATGDAERAAAAGTQAATRVITEKSIELDKATDVQELTNKLSIETGMAAGVDAVKGLQAEGLAAATLSNKTEPLIGIQGQLKLNLESTAAAAINSTGKTIPALVEQTAAQQRLAVASGQGADAEHKQSVENVALAATYNALVNARASGDPVLKAEALRLYEINLQLQKQNDLAQTATQVHDQETINTNQIQNANLQISLQGQTSEAINRQVTLLQTKQFLLSKNIDITKELTDGEKQLAQGYLESVNNVGLINEKLAETQRQQQRVDQLFQGFGETISSTLGTAIENAFSGQKVQDWGAQLKQIIAQVLAQIVQFEFIRPAIGTALQAIGLSQAAQNFGSIGAVTGGGAGVAAIGGGGSGALGALGNVTSTASTASVLSGGSIFGAGGFSSFVNNIGGKIGFASQTEIPIGEAISQGFGPLAQNAAGNATVTVPGSLFGGATLGSTLSGAGLGFGAGTTLNALRGGNTLGGTIGSGLGGIGGSLAGVAIGTALFPGIGTAAGALIGGLVGGSGGGLLGGLFGNNKPSNAASGANINIGAGGVVSPLQSSGNQQNNQTVNQITSAVSQFTNTLLTLTKGVADSTVNIQAGVRDGIKASITGPSGTTNIQTKDPTDAINQIELNIARGLTNVSDTLKTVLAHVTDPAQIQAGITFAATYDDLKQAADSAFSSISTDVKTIGPFAAALTSLNTTFSTLTDQANQFGLSLDPINAGLAEATKRLQQDFGAALNTALNTAGNTDFINQLTGVSQGFATNVQDQSAIGLRNDQVTTGKVNQLEIEQAQAILSPLTTAQLRIVLDAFKVTNPEISAMAKALLDAGISADSATSSLNTTATALQNFVTGVKAIEDAVKALHTGALAGLTPAQQVTSAQQDFQGQLAVVKAAGAGATGDQLNQLAALAQTVIQTAQSVYGNAPQTADLRNTVIDSLNSVLKTTGPSTAVNLTPAISPAQAAIQASPAVASTQANATSAAIAAAAAAAPPTTSAIPIATSTPTQTVAVASTPVAATSVTTTNDITTALRDFSAGNNTPAESASIQNYANQWFAGDVSKALASYRNNQLPAASLVGQYAIGTLPMATMMFSQGVAANENSQSLAKGTPSGQILVGEKGPEYMLPKGGNWIQVGKTGPEIINQSGGAIILPYPLTPERAFAGGTDNNIGIGDIGGQAAGIGSAISEASGGPSLLGAAGGLLDIPSATLSALGDVLPIAGPIIGGLIGLATGGNVASSVIGTAASLIGFAVGGPIGGVIGGLVGLVGKLFGPKPSNNASGDLIDLATGNISGFQSSGDKNASNIVAQISTGISTITQTLQAATGGTISGAVNVQDGKRDGIKTSYSGPLGNIDAKWGKADDVVGQFALAIAHNLVGIDPALRDGLSSVNDASALVSTIQTFFSSSAKTDTTAASTATTSTVIATSTATPIAPPPPPPTLQQMYDSVVGSDTTNFNNDTGLQNKVNLVNLLTAYGSLSTDAKTNYVDTISKDPTSFNNTPVGIVNKLNLANFLSPSGTVTGENLAPNVDNLMKQYNALPSYAGGTKGTPSGKILVGEKGPEWMYAGNVTSMAGYRETLPNMSGWSLVGKRGPEVIDQRGGATILPFPHTPWEAAGRSFALGTDALPEMTFAAPTAPAPTPTQGNESQAALIKKLDELRSEFVALRRVTAGVGQDASDKAETGNRHLDDINRKTAPAITGPRRQKFG